MPLLCQDAQLRENHSLPNHCYYFILFCSYDITCPSTCISSTSFPTPCRQDEGCWHQYHFKRVKNKKKRFSTCWLFLNTFANMIREGQNDGLCVCLFFQSYSLTSFYKCEIIILVNIECWEHCHKMLWKTRKRKL